MQSIQYHNDKTLYHSTEEEAEQLAKKYSNNKRYFIFMVRFGQFPENGQRQMAYIIYLIEVWGNTYKKASASKQILQISMHMF